MGKVNKNPIGVAAVKTSKTRKPTRYFNSDLNSTNKKKVQKGEKSKVKSSSVKNKSGKDFSRPKPKRLKKGPFKVQKEKSPGAANKKSDDASPKKKFKRKSTGKGNTTAKEDSSEPGSNETEQTPETRKRIAKIKTQKGSGQLKSQKQAVAKVIVKHEGRWYQVKKLIIEKL